MMMMMMMMMISLASSSSSSSSSFTSRLEQSRRFLVRQIFFPAQSLSSRLHALYNYSLAKKKYFVSLANTTKALLLDWKTERLSSSSWCSRLSLPSSSSSLESNFN
jgi:cell division protein FtsW (lipid II flippase)